MENAFERNLLFVDSLKKVDKTTPTVNCKLKRLEKEKELLSAEAVTTNSMLTITLSFITKHKCSQRNATAE